jgi:hypothetical protein
MRRTIVRYAVLAYIITLKHVSVRVKKRFPTLQHIVDAGEWPSSCVKIIHDDFDDEDDLRMTTITASVFYERP